VGVPEQTVPAERLRELAERYAWLFEDSPTAKYVCRLDGEVLEANSALCRLLGATRDEIVGQTIGSFAIDPLVSAAELGPFLSGQVSSYSSARNYRCADGRAMRAMVTLTAMRDPNGAARTIFGELEDLTAQHVAGTELDRQRRRLEMAIEASCISVWELDVASGRMTVQDQAPTAGEPRERTMTYGDFVSGFHPADRSLLPTMRALRSHACGELDVELRAGPAFGPCRWAHVKGRAVSGEDGSVVRVVGTTADITEPRAQRAEVAAQRDRLELALETARMMAWEVGLGAQPSFSAVRGDILGLVAPGPTPVSGVLASPVFGERVIAADRELVGEAVRRSLQSPGSLLDIEYRWRDDEGSVRWLHTRARAEVDDRGRLRRVTGTTADVTTARGEVTARLRAERVLSLTLGASPDAFIGVDGQGLVTDWNPAAEAMFGWSSEEIVGEALVERLSGAGTADLLGVLAPASSEAPTGPDGSLHPGGLVAGSHGARAELEVPTRDGRHFPAEISAVRVEEEGVPFLGLFVRDLSERKAYEDQLVHNALIDPLTGLANRALLVDRLSGAVRRLGGSPGLLSVLFIDIDRFKHINESISRRAGDELLVQVAERVRSVLRPSDTAARFGADEFVVLCEALSGEHEAMAVALRVEGVFSAPFVLGHSPGREVYISAASGIALAGDPGTDAEDLVRDAETAMRRAKQHGGGRAELFDAEVRSRSMAYLETESELRRALERRALSLYYQPVVDLTGKLVKVEALVRWVQPSGRVALPAEFIPLAEETGLIVPLGEVVLQMACDQLGRWRSEHPRLAELGVSVNLSGAQLRPQGALERIVAIIERAGLPIGSLILEITESVLMDESTGAGNKLATLRSAGALLAVDDFGTGYSSLLYLRSYPLDMLKIDRSFVSGLADNPEDAAIVDAVVKLGHSFGLQTVAEGVETLEQLARLRSLGCDLGQGYFWSRPLPPEDLVPLLLAEELPL